MPEPLTQAERRILDYIVDYLRRHTYQPSIREIGREFDIKSTKTVSEYLQSLADKGWIERDPSRSRGVRILGLDLSPETVTVPAFGDGAGGATAAHEDEDEFEAFELDRRIAGRTGTFFLPMRGDGMARSGIRDGDLLVLEPVPVTELEHGDLVAGRLGGQIVVKRFVRGKSGDILESAEGGYAPILLGEARDLAVLGRLLVVIRRLRASAARPALAPGEVGREPA